MGIQTSWYEGSKRIILHQYDGDWTTQDYFDAMQDRDQLTQSVQNPVIILSNYLHSRSLPQGFVQALQNFDRRKPENEEIHIIVSQTGTHSLIMNVIERIQPGTMPQLYAVRTQQEAEKLLEKLGQQNASV